jgi:outer membrane protein assembly factor BamC
MAGCSDPVKREYEEATFGRPLEVPPDLTLPNFDESLELKSAGGAPATVPAQAETAPLVVLPDQANMYLARDGAQRWLVLNGEPAQVWPWVRGFFLQKGFALRYEDPATGIIETEWTNQQTAAPSDGARTATESTIYTIPTRDKYRVRFERGEKPGTTELYLTHQGAELSKQDDMLAWQLRPTNLEFENEMLKGLLVHFGIEQEKAGGVLAAPREIVRRATLASDAQGAAIMHIDEDFARAWRRVELVLDRAGFQIEDRDRSNGVFYVVSREPLRDLNEEEQKGWFARWFGSKDEEREYQIVLKDEGEATNVYVRDKDGEKIDNEKAEPVLKQLHERLQ